MREPHKNWAFSKAHDIQYAEVDPHSGQELENDYDVE